MLPSNRERLVDATSGFAFALRQTKHLTGAGSTDPHAPVAATFRGGSSFSLGFGDPTLVLGAPVTLPGCHLVASLTSLRRGTLCSSRSRVPAPLVPGPREFLYVSGIPQSSQLGFRNRLETTFTCKLSYPLGRHVQAARDPACGHQGGGLFHHFLIVPTASGMF